MSLEFRRGLLDVFNDHNGELPFVKWVFVSVKEPLKYFNRIFEIPHEILLFGNCEANVLSDGKVSIKAKEFRHTPIKSTGFVYKVLLTDRFFWFPYHDNSPIHMVAGDEICMNGHLEPKYNDYPEKLRIWWLKFRYRIKKRLLFMK